MASGKSGTPSTHPPQLPDATWALHNGDNRSTLKGIKRTSNYKLVKTSLRFHHVNMVVAQDVPYSIHQEQLRSYLKGTFINGYSF